MTIVSTFPSTPERAQELLDLLAAVAERVLRQRTGFIDARLLVSEDRTRVVNLARRQHAGDVRAMMGDPAVREVMAPVWALSHPEPVRYRTAGEFRPAT
ncbi:antibiotic biosynthesis monooxygenase [Streptomyces sp. NPDC101237]|uniref:antibiotic biosynthesis monooxygenase n=1 Tax=Streptomyces sp. NPDC101237 TaxID=3366139 RepID=UPI00381A3466